MGNVTINIGIVGNVTLNIGIVGNVTVNIGIVGNVTINSREHIKLTYIFTLHFDGSIQWCDADVVCYLTVSLPV